MCGFRRIDPGRAELPPSSVRMRVGPGRLLKDAVGDCCLFGAAGAEVAGGGVAGSLARLGTGDV